MQDQELLTSNLIAMVRAKAVALGLDPALACALAETESGWNTWALRYEPAFYSHYESSQNLPPTEKNARATSWGLFQVMGETARSVGFKGDIPSICDPEVGIDVGLQVWQKKLTLAKGDVNKALLFWNGGSDVNYPKNVLSRVNKYQA